jgi:uncharacterized protein with HEPN domain
MMDDAENLSHVLEAGRRVREYTRAGRSAFESDLLIQDAVIRNFEVIGEAVKNLSETLRSNHAGLRDTLIHRYFLVQLDLIWDVVENHLPLLMTQIAAIHASLSETPQNTSQNQPDSTDEAPT